MKQLFLLLSLSVLTCFAAYADLSFERVKAGDSGFPPGPRGDGTCTLQHYNSCSGWVLVWRGWDEGDMVGTIFDLPDDCATYDSGSAYSLLSTSWLIYDIIPRRGFHVNIEVYQLDEDDCLLEPIGGLYEVDFTNLEPAWVELVVPCEPITEDRFAVTMKWNQGIYPKVGTDNPGANFDAPQSCPGYVEEMHSYVFFDEGVEMCPPMGWHDGVFCCNQMMRATLAPATGTETSSWGAVKALFR